MSKKKVIKVRPSSYERNSQTAKAEIRNALDEKYFNIWLSKYEFENLSRDQREFYMRKLWGSGRCAAFDIINPKQDFMGQSVEDYQDGLLGLADFAPMGYNMFNFPTTVQLINNRGVPYIPTAPQVAGKDCVIGFALHSRSPIASIVKPFIDRLVEIEMVIRTNLLTSKKGLIVSASPEDQTALNDIISQWEWDEPIIRTKISNPNGFVSTPLTNEYIVDKLYQYRTQVENELLTILGVKNSGTIFKKAHELKEEVNSTESLTDNFSDGIDQNIQEFWREVERVLGYKVTVTNVMQEREDEASSTLGEEGKDENTSEVLPNP